jgi:NTF2-like N-terminal transpeptidase domain
MSYDPNQPNGQNQPEQPYVPPTQYNPPPTDYSQPPYAQQPYGQQPAYEQAPYRDLPMAPDYVQPQAKKSTSRRLWITLAVVGGILVLGCGGCIIASVAGISLFGTVVSTVIAPSATANSYYTAIEKQDYATAFNFLDINSASVEGQQLTQDAFVLLAQTVDLTKGTVTSFKQTGVSVNSNTSSGNTATVTMSVTRNGSSYTVHLQLQETNNVWKITSVDNI